MRKQYTPLNAITIRIDNYHYRLYYSLINFRIIVIVIFLALVVHPHQQLPVIVLIISDSVIIITENVIG